MIMLHLWKEFVQNEIVAYKKIWKHNQSCDSDGKINVPKFLFSGEVTGSEMVTIETRKGNDRIFCGPYLVLEKLKGNLRHTTGDRELEKANQEIKKLAAIGIIPKNVCLENFLFDESSIFVFGFQHVEFRKS
ncbi:unnamed protein product [Ambrosiozyma monospora]|uniref:Unnamed protein product n=1 Tax=Ambrosiozyma monospora TaxID=43982 RepID=A0ACB5U3Y4_AMBMO|nr:unnamed protein product [Ambrosiozyma monospora]